MVRPQWLGIPDSFVSTTVRLHECRAKGQALRVEVLPKQLDEEVARYMMQGFGGVITRMTEKQAKYLGVPVEGPYKPHEYRY